GQLVFVSQSRRGWEAGRPTDRRAVYGIAECIPLSPRIQSELQLSQSRTELGAGTRAVSRRYHRTGRYRRQRKAGEGLVAAEGRRPGATHQARPAQRETRPAAACAEPTAKRGRRQEIRAQRRADVHSRALSQRRRSSGPILTFASLLRQSSFANVRIIGPLANYKC